MDQSAHLSDDYLTAVDENFFIQSTFGKFKLIIHKKTGKAICFFCGIEDINTAFHE
jgi:hypothetical protein